MKRTRKWVYVAQEATRLASLGLAPKDIAARLGVSKSTVTRWMSGGKIRSTKAGYVRQRPVGHAQTPIPPKTPREWSIDIRNSFDLDATDDQLVTIAESALAMSLDVTATPQVRLQAAGRFQAVVKQLALVARASDAQEGKPDTPVRRVLPHRSGGDPRAVLVAVK